MENKFDQMIHHTDIISIIRGTYMRIKGNKVLKNCLNFFPNLHSEGVIVKKLLCPKKIPTVFTIFP